MTMLEQDAVVIVVIAARAALIPPLVQEASSPLDFNLHIGQLLIYPTALFTTWTSNLCTCSSSGVNLFDIAQYHVEMFIECKYMASQRSTNAVDVANHDAHPLLLRMDISKQSKRSLVKSIGERRKGPGKRRQQQQPSELWSQQPRPIAPSAANIADPLPVAAGGISTHCQSEGPAQQMD